MTEQDRSKRIAELNDRFRTSMGASRMADPPIPGMVLMTAGINALPDSQKHAILEKVRRFDDFTEDNDPYGEHDFGVIQQEGVGKIFWKIDYYDSSLEKGSEDPADPSVTMRVLTIMLAEEY